MKIKIQQARLSKALNYAARAVSNKPNIPVLSNVLINVKKDRMSLAATNLDMGIHMWIPGVSEMDGSLTASGKFLSDFINVAGGDKVELELKNDVLYVATDSSKAEFQTIPPSEFPVLPKSEGEPFFTINTAEFIESMDKVLFACSTDVTTSRIQFTGVLFELSEKKPNSVDFIGLNGFRMSRRTTAIERSSEDAHQLIVPARSLQELIRILNTEDVEQVEVYLSESKSQIIFKIDDIEVSIRLLEGPYPDYKAAIPTEHAFSFDVNRDELEHALKIVQTFARSSMGNKVNWDLDIEKSELTMHTEVTDLGRNETKLAVQNASGSSDLKDAYSLQFLLDMAQHMNGDVVHFETNAPLSAAVFTEKKDKNFMHLIMPVQRDD